MRGLSLLDVLVIGVTLALLAFAASRDFSRYAGHTLPPPAATADPNR